LVHGLDFWPLMLPTEVSNFDPEKKSQPHTTTETIKFKSSFIDSL